MFCKKNEAKSILTPCGYILIGMAAAFGVVALSKPGKRFIKSKISALSARMDNCPVMSK